MEGILKSTKIPYFDGKSEKFAQWSYTFLSICSIAGCKEVLVSDTVQVPAETVDLDPLDPANDQDIKLRKANSTAYALLTMVINNPTAFQAIRNGCTTALPNGSAREAWKNLIRIYQPKTTTQKVELEQKFNKMTLDKETKNPDEFFTELEHIRLILKEDHNEDYDDDKLIQHIIYNTTPKCYELCVQIYKRELGRGVNIELNELKNEIRSIFIQNKKKDKKEETALSAGQFKGKCRVCGKQGHKGENCWTLEKNKNKRPKNYKKPDTVKTDDTVNAAVTPDKRTDDKKFYCNYCKKDNHNEDRCFKKLRDLSTKNDNDTANTSGEKCDVMLAMMGYCNFTTDDAPTLSKYSFIADSGASSHMVNDKSLLRDFVPNKTKIKVGDNRTIFSTGHGTYKGYHTNKQGEKVSVFLNKVLHVPELWTNLFSINTATRNKDTTIICEDELITVKGKNKDIHFQDVTYHGNGKILSTEFKQDDNNEIKELANLTEVANLFTTKMEYNDLHRIMGHAHKRIIKDTANKLKIKLIDSENGNPCTDCTMAKLRIRNFGNDSTTSTEVGGTICMDISGVRTVSYGGAKFWLLLLDEYSDFVWSFFLHTKDELGDTVISWINDLSKVFTVKTIKCDNAGENKDLQKLVKENKLDIKFEYSAPNSPQQNGKVERKFATMWGKVRAMLNSARLPWKIRNKLWAQCAKHCTNLENILVKKENKTPYEIVYKKLPKWIKYLRMFGEIAVIHNNNDIQSKLENRGYIGLYVGHPDDHAKEVCQFFKLSTQKLILSRTYKFLNITYDQYYLISKKEISHVSDDDEMEIIFEKENNNLPIGNVNMDTDSDTSEDSEEERDHWVDNTGIHHWADNTGMPRELRNLQTFYNPNPFRFMQDEETAEIAMLTKFFGQEEIILQSTLYDGNPDPKNIMEAKATKEWKEWWKAISTEFKNMHEKEVWEIVQKSDIPKDRRVLQCRWVFVQKDDGRYRARCVAKGFTQIPGKDFTENHSPVLNDTTFHLILALKILYKLESGQFDIETAFLYGELEEKLWMDYPEGYSDYLKENGIHLDKLDTTKYCLKLNKSIYGLVQAARQWWKKFKTVILSLGYKACEADPCLFIKDNKNETKSFIAIYVDDGGIFSTEENIKEVLTELSKTFMVKDLGKMETFLGCKIIENEEKDTIYIHQPKLIKNLKSTFGKYVEKMMPHTTPANPLHGIIRPKKEDQLISSEYQKLFRSGVGMLMWLVKHSRPDMNNATRELSKVADGATEAHWKNLLRAINYVINTEEMGLKIKPTKDKNKNLFYLQGISDSTYADDKDDRTSVYGYIVYFCGAPIAWKSKGNKSVTLSSTEAEYFAISEVAKEILFIKQVLESIGVPLEYPIEIKVDNIGAMFLANNHSTSQRTKHIDIRTHFVRNYIEDDILKLVFVRTEDNDADMFTKNLQDLLFKKHSVKLVSPTPK